MIKRITRRVAANWNWRLCIVSCGLVALIIVGWNLKTWFPVSQRDANIQQYAHDVMCVQVAEKGGTSCRIKILEAYQQRNNPNGYYVFTVLEAEGIINGEEKKGSSPFIFYTEDDEVVHVE